MKKILKNVNKSDKGVVSIVVTMLIIGLVISVAAMVQTAFVPVWMKQKESEHMGEVAKQFTQLKFAIDTIALIGEKNIPVSTPITLGSNEMPFLTTMRSYGDLNIMPNSCEIKIEYYSQEESNTKNVSFKAGTIRYSSSNAYYMNQEYVYENGALILSQDAKDIMVTRPSLSVLSNKDLSFTIFRISEFDDKTSVTGYGTYPIQTSFINSRDYNYVNIKSITVKTSYNNSWGLYFEDVLKTTGDDKYSFEITSSSDRVIITFASNDEITSLPDLGVKLVNVGAQISIGWGE